MTITDPDLKARRQMCVDLEYLMTQDMSIREEIIDEYVYLLSDKRFEEMQEFVNKELIADYQMKFTLWFIQGVTIVLVTHIIIQGGM